MQRPHLSTRAGRGGASAAVLAAVAFAAGIGSASPSAAESPPTLKVYAYTLNHQPTRDALALIRPLLSPRGTVEEQPGSRTLVIRDAPPIIDRVVPLLEDFDHPPQDLRFDIRIVRAGPARPGVGPPLEPGSAAVADVAGEALIARLKEVLRYDDYRLLAKAGVSSKEGDEITHSLGGTYSVSFRPGTVMAGRRLKLENFRIEKRVQNPANKGRQLEPRQLYRATLNLWLDRPFSIVLTDDSGEEALLVAISCRREGGEPESP